tara:strand:+ start:586 stop:1083 length:498 start_codon:yes stop_codon:yes gene_type:complete
VSDVTYSEAVVEVESKSVEVIEVLPVVSEVIELGETTTELIEVGNNSVEVVEILADSVEVIEITGENNIGLPQGGESGQVLLFSGATPSWGNIADIFNVPERELFTFEFTGLSSCVTVDHNLGRPVFTTMFDSNGNKVEPVIEILNENSLVVSAGEVLTGYIHIQ